MKLIKDYTLGEVRGLCKQYDTENCSACPLFDFCGEKGKCPPCYWELKSGYDSITIDDAHAIQRVFPDAISVARTETELYITDELGERQLNYNLLPGLEVGENVLLADITNEN